MGAGVLDGAGQDGVEGVRVVHAVVGGEDAHDGVRVVAVDGQRAVQDRGGRVARGGFHEQVLQWQVRQVFQDVTAVLVGGDDHQAFQAALPGGEALGGGLQEAAAAAFQREELLGFALAGQGPEPFTAAVNQDHGVEGHGSLMSRGA